MDLNRRNIMMAAMAGATLAAASDSLAAANDARLMHHVFFWLKRPGSAADRAALIAGLRKLAAIQAVRTLHIGTPAPTEQRDVVDASWDVSELMVFDDAVAQKTYQDHPLHRAFIDECAHLWRKVVVYDAITA